MGNAGRDTTSPLALPAAKGVAATPFPVERNRVLDPAGGRSDTGAAQQWMLWQLCDSGMPTGGFAHSGGLEAAAAQGIVRENHTGSLLRFVRGTLANACSLQLPLVREALRGDSLDAWLEVDSVAHACITAEAARRASLAQGAGLLRAAQAMFPLDEISGVIVSEFRALVREGAAFQGARQHYQGTDAPTTTLHGQEARRVAHGHHAPAFGVVCRALGVGERQAARAFMFLVARDVLSAATRLSLVGPLEAGRIVSSLAGYVEELSAMGEAGDASRREEGAGGRELQEAGGGGAVMGRVCQVDPVQDIVQGLHDRLYSRMFNS